MPQSVFQIRRKNGSCIIGGPRKIDRALSYEGGLEMLFAAVHESGRAQNGHGAMSGLSLLWAAKRTWQIISVPVDWACSTPASVYAIAPVARRWVIGTSGILPPMGDQGGADDDPLPV